MQLKISLLKYYRIYTIGVVKQKSTEIQNKKGTTAKILASPSFDFLN